MFEKIDNNKKPDYNELEKHTMSALIGLELPETQRKEFEDFVSQFIDASDEDLVSMIQESSNFSAKEESLAREFIKRDIDIQVFLGQAKYRTTKAILRDELK